MPSHFTHIVYDALVLLLRVFVVDVFFREINSRGSYAVPMDGPVIFVIAPHANQFVDPLVLLRHCPRRVGFLVALKSYRRRFVGLLARALQAIPVARPQDDARRAKGMLCVSPDDPCILLSIQGGPTFLEESIRPKDSLAISGVEGEPVSVTEMLDADRVRVSRPVKFTGEGATTSCAYKIMPFIDQAGVYDAVYERLSAGECIGIFPEGGSHDRAEMLPLKAGVTLMALGAMARNPSLDVKIVPCGLSYFNPDRFRSRAVIEFGKALTIDPSLVSRFKEGGAAKREACGELLEMIYQSLRAVTVNAPDYKTLQVIQAARRLYSPTDTSLSMTQKLEVARRFMEGFDRMKDQPRVQAIAARIHRYNNLLAAFGIRDHQVESTEMRRSTAAVLLIWRLVKLTALTLVLVPGLMINGPIGLVARTISHRKAVEAKLASSVKIAGRDVLATWKLMVAVVLVPLVHMLGAAWVTIMVGDALSPRWSTLSVFFIALAGLIMVSTGSIQFLESASDTYKLLPPLWLCVRGADETMELRELRKELQVGITQLVEDMGPSVGLRDDGEVIWV